MANPVFSAMGGQPNIMQMLQQIKNNPAEIIMRSRFNIPKDMQNNPQAMIQHLLSSGQVSQQQINQAYQSLQRMGLK